MLVAMRRDSVRGEIRIGYGFVDFSKVPYISVAKKLQPASVSSDKPLRFV